MIKKDEFESMIKVLPLWNKIVIIARWVVILLFIVHPVIVGEEVSKKYYFYIILGVGIVELVLRKISLDKLKGTELYQKVIRKIDFIVLFLILLLWGIQFYYVMFR